MKKIVGIIIVLVVLGLAWWLGSPLFINKTVDEALPGLDTAATEPSEPQDTAAATDTVAADVMAAVEKLRTQVPAEEQAAFMAQMKQMVKVDHDMLETMPLSSPTDISLLAQGEFTSVAHEGTGTAKLLHFAGADTTYLRFENLDVLNGPDLRVLLSKNTNVNSSDDLGEYIELAKLKGNKGDQNYELPADIDINAYKSVVIYCKPFHVVFNSAALQYGRGGGSEAVSGATAVDAAVLAGAWKPIPPSIFGWEDIVFDRIGEYTTHLNDKPFDGGMWYLTDSGSLQLVSEAGADFSYTLTDLEFKDNVLYFKHQGTPTMWGKVLE